MRNLLICLLLPLFGLHAQVGDTLLQAVHWTEDGHPNRLLLTPDGTFQEDYGPDAGSGRYLMGRYRVDEDNQEITLSVDYFLGKRRIPDRYRRGQDFHLLYRIDTLSADRLVLVDLLTGEARRFTAAPLDPEDDPARRRIRRKLPTKLELPEGWDGG
ncbi:hypothetical protein [Neolewinella litorea]|uniref:Uncharacterized protein n=1 Tax=Neolewinella litorea TaxID=2562452 RepID=A0A4S4NNS8_9BACT|nr:hypothetical protein [Neolewinella litorea]THH40685.1 hypothetical protein E4021_08120 [Neolewinella litorea]